MFVVVDLALTKVAYALRVAKQFAQIVLVIPIDN